MYRLLQKIIGVSGFVLAIVLPAIYGWHSLFPWEEARSLLESEFPGQTYIRVGGARKWSLDGSSRTSSYLIWPENKTVKVSKNGEQAAYLSNVNGSAWGYMISVLSALILFVFFGLPGLKDMLGVSKC